jgi:hypothetical protein
MAAVETPLTGDPVRDRLQAGGAVNDFRLVFDATGAARFSLSADVAVTPGPQPSATGALATALVGPGLGGLDIQANDRDRARAGRRLRAEPRIAGGDRAARRRLAHAPFTEVPACASS